jgi:hypothetical protein
MIEGIFLDGHNCFVIAEQYPVPHALPARSVVELFFLSIADATQLACDFMKCIVANADIYQWSATVPRRSQLGKHTSPSPVHGRIIVQFVRQKVLMKRMYHPLLRTRCIDHCHANGCLRFKRSIKFWFDWTRFLCRLRIPKI